MRLGGSSTLFCNVGSTFLTLKSLVNNRTRLDTNINNSSFRLYSPDSTTHQGTSPNSPNCFIFYIFTTLDISSPGLVYCRGLFRCTSYPSDMGDIDPHQRFLSRRTKTRICTSCTVGGRMSGTNRRGKLEGCSYGWQGIGIQEDMLCKRRSQSWM